MGQSKGGGYSKMDVLSPEQKTLLNQILGQSNNYTQQAAQGFSNFLPGGAGAEAIQKQALQNYQQQTIPSIMNAFGSNAKSSSALNQALASSASNLNTDLGAQLAQMQLQAASGLGSLGMGQSQLGLQTAPFGYLQRQMPLWQQLLLAGIQSGGQIGGAAIGASKVGGF